MKAAMRGTVFLLRIEQGLWESENPTVGLRAQGWLRYCKCKLQKRGEQGTQYLAPLAVQSARVTADAGATLLSVVNERGAASGTVTVNTDPTPTSLRTCTSPPIPRARPRLIARPRPVPSVV